MARTVFLQKSWTDLPIECISPLLCPSLSNSKNLCYPFLLFNPFSTRCPNNNQPNVSLFYFFLFFDFLYFSGGFFMICVWIFFQSVHVLGVEQMRSSASWCCDNRFLFRKKWFLPTRYCTIPLYFFVSYAI